MEPYSLPVNLLRQWCFCPRVVYYRELLGMNVLEPIWSKQGSEYHKKETELFKRRNLTRFNLSSGIKHYNINLKGESIKIHGICDLVIETSDNIFAVEYKLGRQISFGHIMQTFAYSILAEEHFGKKASHGFIISGDNKVQTIEIDLKKREKLNAIVNRMMEMLTDGRKPNSSATSHQCGQCEYINHCNDRET